MRIAILNLQYDNNYGGNLQRYALMTILDRMGHDVTHLNLRSNYDTDSTWQGILQFLRIIKYKLFNHYKGPFFPKSPSQQAYINDCNKTEPFYNKYVKHTKAIYKKQSLRKYKNFDAYIVGSDQVWRKEYASHHGLSTFFFDFLPAKCKARRIAYGVSFGIEEDVLTQEEITELSSLYERFYAVSVRESSAFKLLNKYHWSKPTASLVLDPTLLLNREDYIKIYEDANTDEVEGDMFCYILDWSKEKGTAIEKVKAKYGLTPFYIKRGGFESIEQWLRSFAEAKYVVTDSYHGVVFSIIFNKPFTLIRNKERGNARFSSLMELIFGNEEATEFDWEKINSNLKHWRESSLKFLNDALK